MSDILTLSERLKSQIQSDQKLIENQTRQVLTQHSESLRRLSSDALSTTKSAIKSESDLLLKSITSVRTQAEAHVSKLPQMLWIAMLWPILTTAAACLLMIGLTWLYLPTELYTAKTETWTMQTQRGPVQATVIIDRGWTVCTDGDQQRPCKIKK